MANASLTQLSAIGHQDRHFTLDATHTFWKTVYAKHTNFALEPKEVPFSAGTPDYGSRHSDVIILRHGDLVTKMWLLIRVNGLGNTGTDATPPNALAIGNKSAMFTNDFGRAFIEEYQINIGSVVFDKRTGEYLHIWEELTQLLETQFGRLTGKSTVESELPMWALNSQLFYVPINAWFTEDRANAIPIVALYQHDIRIQFQFRKKDELIVRILPSYMMMNPEEGRITDIKMVIEYVFLENHERNWFSGGHHEYLINQVQFVGSVPVPASAGNTISVPITFNHPTKELIMVFRKISEVQDNQYFNFEGSEPFGNAFANLRLLLNSSDKFVAREADFFRIVQNQCHHTRIPDKHIYTYSFALWPEKPDPTGSINFSRIDNASLRFEFTPDTVLNDWNEYPLVPDVGLGPRVDMELLIFNRNLNITRIRNGMAHLNYA